MKSALTTLAGLLVGILVAFGILAALVFAGPAPIVIRATPAPTVSPSVAPTVSPSVAASPAASAPPSAAPSVVLPSGGPSAPIGSPAAALGASRDPAAAFRIDQPAAVLAVAQAGGATIDLAGLRGPAGRLDVVGTTRPAWITVSGRPGLLPRSRTPHR